SRLGLACVIENAQFSEIGKAMEAGRSYDVAIASFSIPSEQPEGVAFSEAYFYGDNAVIVRSDSVFHAEEEDLEADELVAQGSASGNSNAKSTTAGDSAAKDSAADESGAQESADRNTAGSSAGPEEEKSEEYVSLDSLKDKTIASVSGYSQVQYIKENFTDSVIEYSSAQACLDALEAGEVDAVVLEYYQSKVQIANRQGLEIFARIASTDSYGVMVNSKNAELLEDINEALQAMKKDGTLSRLEKEYLH
ncbi:MAG: substrate-binding periplasmic protein, partial [Anaerotardibacter sp.]